MANYDITSPYYTTGYSQFFLDTMTNRPIPPLQDDLSFAINLNYQYRPDHFANDLYSNPGLWWVFYQRNPNTLTKPPLDFAVGVEIFLPRITTLQTVLGF